MQSKPSCWVLTLLLLALGQPVLAEGLRHFVYLSNQRLITFELIDPHHALLNYVNLSPDYVLLEATKVLTIDADQISGRGHLIERENENGQVQYKVTDLIGPREFRGYNLVGNLSAQQLPTKVLLGIGSKTIRLEGLSEEDFELLADRVEDLELDRPNADEIILYAGFKRPYGALLESDSPERGTFDLIVTSEDTLAPIVLENPSPRLPSSARHLSDPVVVLVGVLVRKNGSLGDFEIVEGVDDAVDRIALSAVRNSWRLLPAVSSNQVVDATATLRVVFSR